MVHSLNLVQALSRFLQPLDQRLVARLAAAQPRRDRIHALEERLSGNGHLCPWVRHLPGSGKRS